VLSDVQARGLSIYGADSERVGCMGRIGRGAVWRGSRIRRPSNGPAVVACYRPPDLGCPQLRPQPPEARLRGAGTIEREAQLALDATNVKKTTPTIAMPTA
jgi:hypothetical protein